jgi:hypothetical protein
MVLSSLFEDDEDNADDRGDGVKRRDCAAANQLQSKLANITVLTNRRGRSLLDDGTEGTWPSAASSGEEDRVLEGISTDTASGGGPVSCRRASRLRSNDDSLVSCRGLVNGRLREAPLNNRPS